MDIMKRLWWNFHVFCSLNTWKAVVQIGFFFPPVHKKIPLTAPQHCMFSSLLLLFFFQVFYVSLCFLCLFASCCLFLVCFGYYYVLVSCSKNTQTMQPWGAPIQYTGRETSSSSSYLTIKMSNLASQSSSFPKTSIKLTNAHTIPNDKTIRE